MFTPIVNLKLTYLVEPTRPVQPTRSATDTTTGTNQQQQRTAQHAPFSRGGDVVTISPKARTLLAGAGEQTPAEEGMESPASRAAEAAKGR